MGDEPERAKTASDAGWLTTREAALLLSSLFGRRIPHRTCLQWCGRRVAPLKHVKLGGRTLIHRDELLAWINRGSDVLDRGNAA